MRTYGEIRLEPSPEGTFWIITCEPQVMMRIKDVFRRVNKNGFGLVTLKDCPEVCRDLEWFLLRYPLVNANAKELKAGAELHRRQRIQMDRIMTPGHVGLSFPLAVPARDYQAKAAELFLTKGALLLADELGVGKSVTALAAVTEGRTKPALVVVYPFLQKQWDRYAGRFMPLARTHIIKKSHPYDLPEADIYIITYHKLAGWASFLAGFIKCVIFDEAQELRRAGSQKYEAAKHIRNGADYCMGLSATPIYNYGGEIFNVLEIIAPGHLGTEAEFYREWCQFLGNDKWTIKQPEAFGSYLREEHLMLRRSRTDVGRQLPPVQTHVETVEHDEKVLDDLDDQATELALRLLRQDIDFHERGEAAREFDLKMRQATGIAKAPFVAAFVRMLVENGESVLLTGWHRAVYDIWAAKLGLPFSMFTGSESPTQKQQSILDFVQGVTKVFVMSLRSGAGLDGLQEKCSTIVHGELDWAPGIHEQCRGRIFRDGQKQGVMEYFLISDGGSDPIIADVLGLKKAQLTGILEPGNSGLATQSDTGSRVKKMAEEYLAKKRINKMQLVKT